MTKVFRVYENNFIVFCEEHKCYEVINVHCKPTASFKTLERAEKYAEKREKEMMN